MFEPETFEPEPDTPRWGARFRFLVFLLALLGTCWLTVADAESATTADPSNRPTVVEVFVRDGCPHCADAKVFLSTLARERQALSIVYRQIDRNPEELDALIERSREAGVWPPGVPTFVVAGRVMVGFDTAATSGRELLALIDPAASPRDRVEVPLFGVLSASRLGLPAFTVALGLLDGFNPCAMWVLLFLLSLLVRLRDRARMAWIAGTFVLVSGIVYYAFMAAWLNVFLLVGLGTTLRWTLGGFALLVGGINVKDFAARERGPSLSIPDSAKPGLYARVRSIVGAPGLTASLGAVAALALVVNFFELLCTAGFPAVYTAVLTQQPLSPPMHYAYLGLYIAAYVADDALMVTIAVAALGSRKLTERAGRWLKLASGAVMLALGFTLILRPDWLI